jgi:pimeloyl-ACP methyl ester carboxylesterase
MGGLLNCFDNTGQDTIFRETDIDPANVPASHRGFLVAPWCRGNSMYHEAGESDFWQIIDLVKKQFEIDEDRMYLSGFSMGGGGTWNLAGRRPDLWAAVSPASGFWGGSDIHLDFLTDNLKAVPVKLWCGELDAGMLPGAKQFAKVLADKGFQFDCTIAKGLPHTYPYPDYQATVAWLMSHTRKPANQWTYATDTARYSGTRGVEMNVPAQIDPAKLPRYACKVDGDTVNVDSWNTGGILVNLGEGGLDLKGNVRVVWNGKVVYTGDPKRVTAGDMPAWRR